MGGAAEGGRIAGRVHVDDVGAHRHVDGGRQAETVRGGEKAYVEVRRLPRIQVTPDGRAQAQAVPVPLDDGAIDLLARLAGHAELARSQARRNVLRGVAGHRQLEVVHHPRPVQRQAGHEGLLHQVDEDRGEPDLDHVGAEPPQDRLGERAAAQHVGGEAAQRLPSEDAGQRVEKLGDRSPARQRTAEVRARHLALAAGQGIGADAGEVQGIGRGAHPRGIASSTIWHRTWTTITWTSWMRAVSACGTSMR